MSHHNRLSNDTSSSIDLKIFIKDVNDTHGRKRPLTVRPWASIKDVKDQLTKHLHIPASSQCIYFGPLLSSSRELPNHRTLQDAGIYRNGDTLLLEIKGNASSTGGGANCSCPSISSLRNQSNDICVSSSTLDLCPKSLQRLVQQSRRGLAVGIKPALAPDGSGGSYFLSDARKIRVGVFKPADEEPFAENNPRGYVPHNTSSASGEDGEWLRQGIRPGELCLREVAAFLLDHDGFSGVPMTTLAEARHPALHTAGAHWTLGEGGAGVGVHSLSSPIPAYLTGSSTSPSNVPSHQELVKKVGSFQEYIHAECTMDDISPSKISVDEVHKIAILDIRIMNADRNVANIMCQRIPEDPDTFRLVPIDHGYSLRNKCDVAWFDWCWLDWPQTKQPLSKASRDYVLGLDIEADARLLQERLNMQGDVLDYFRSSCQVLKAGVRAGLTLYDIASEILCRNDPSGEVPSKLEAMTSMASELAMSAVHNGRFHHATASLALEEKLTTRRLMLNSQPKFSTASKTRPVVRSASSSVFSRFGSLDDASAFTDELSRIESGFSNESQIFKNNSQCIPGTAHTSQSDDSSEGDEDTGSFAIDGPDDSAAGEWAAALVAVADQSMDKDNLFGGRNRSVSESSSDESLSSALSKSPVGFWYVRPGSAMNESYEEDEPSCASPSTQSSIHANPADLSSSLPRILSPSGFSTSNLGKLLSESSPSPFNTTQEALHTTEDVLSDRVGPIPTSFDIPPATYTPLKTMSRSMSYSAFSTHNAAPPNTHLKSNLSRSILNNMRNMPSTTLDHDLFRTYFVKFVDLLVVRETERVLHSKALKS